MKRLEKIPHGESFSMAFFADICSPKPLRRTIHQFIAKGLVIQIMRGILMRASQSLPTSSQVINAIKKAKKSNIQIHGATAAHCLGILEKKNTENIFLTSGRNQQISLGKKQIQLIHANSPWFLLSERKAGIAVACIKYLGRKNVSLDIIKKIHLAIGTEELKAIFDIRNKLPEWFNKILFQYFQNYVFD